MIPSGHMQCSWLQATKAVCGVNLFDVGGGHHEEDYVNIVTLDGPRAYSIHELNALGVIPIMPFPTFASQMEGPGSLVDIYEREFYPLSNFSAFNVMWKRIRFDTSEHVYHYEKFMDTNGAPHLGGVKHQDFIMNSMSAHDAFKYAEAHKADRRPDWDSVRVDVMREILIAKASQHEYVRRKLMETENRLIVECSWRDDFWGWGPKRDGKNMLGILWMEIRDKQLFKELVP